MKKYAVIYQRTETRAFVIDAATPQEAIDEWAAAATDDVRDEFVATEECEFIRMEVMP